MSIHRKRSTRAAASLLCLLMASSLPLQAANPLPERFSAEYVLRAAGMVIGVAHWSLAPTREGRFLFEIRSNTAGVAALLHDDERIERSEWRYHDQHLRPLAYRYSRTGKKNRTVAIEFDWDEGIASNTVKAQTWHMPLPPGTLDKLVYQLAMMRDLDAGQRQVQYPIADGGRLKTYRLEVIGEERLDTALGPLDTLKVRRIRETNKRETTLWCAPALHYLPVQFEQKERDGTIIARIASIEGLKLKEPAIARP